MATAQITQPKARFSGARNLATRTFWRASLPLLSVWKGAATIVWAVSDNSKRVPFYAKSALAKANALINLGLACYQSNHIERANRALGKAVTILNALNRDMPQSLDMTWTARTDDRAYGEYLLYSGHLSKMYAKYYGAEVKMKGQQAEVDNVSTSLSRAASFYRQAAGRLEQGIYLVDKKQARTCWLLAKKTYGQLMVHHTDLTTDEAVINAFHNETYANQQVERVTQVIWWKR